MSNKTLKEVYIYTDGAAEPNPGVGGWGCLLSCYVGTKEHKKEIYGGFAYTTNNRMELYAAIQGLSILKEACKVYLHTDSKYLTNPFNLGWIKNWERKAWNQVKNRDLWEQLKELNAKHEIEWKWIKGHSGHIEQERSDYLAGLSLKDKNLPIDFAYENQLSEEGLCVQESLLIA
jgi:ribonuclease HI